MLSFVKVGFLLGDMNNDARLALGAFVVPPTRRWPWHDRGEGLLDLLRHFLAAAKQNRNCSHQGVLK
jgi:hypothetical protein